MSNPTQSQHVANLDKLGAHLGESLALLWALRKTLQQVPDDEDIPAAISDILGDVEDVGSLIRILDMIEDRVGQADALCIDLNPKSEAEAQPQPQPS